MPVCDDTAEADDLGEAGGYLQRQPWQCGLCGLGVFPCCLRMRVLDCGTCRPHPIKITVPLAVDGPSLGRPVLHVVMSQPHTVSCPGCRGGQVDLSKLSEEETKYLGGDMRFTHLVKGLDYALLHKVGAWGRAGVGGRAAVGPCGQ